MTVKEISNLTGVSVRALHYYDEIGLFTPTQRSEAGYRFYDDEDLEILLQILFFREFDIPLKKIKDTMNKVTLNRIKALKIQSKLLIAKKRAHRTFDFQYWWHFEWRCCKNRFYKCR